MGKRIYQPKTNTTIKLRLQHTDEHGDISPLLEAISDQLEEYKHLMVAFNRPRLGTNPKYEGTQATAMYLELDYALLQWMVAAMSAVNLKGRAA